MRFWGKWLVRTCLMLICKLTFLAFRMRIAESIRHVRWRTLSELLVCQKPGGGGRTTLSA